MRYRKSFVVYDLGAGASWEAMGSEDVEEDTLARLCSLLGLSTEWNGDSKEIIPRTSSRVQTPNINLKGVIIRSRAFWSYIKLPNSALYLFVSNYPSV